MKNLLTKALRHYRSAAGGAAVGLATADAKENGKAITLETVNKYAKLINKIAGVIIFIFVFGVGFSVYGWGVAHDDIYSVLTDAEKADISERQFKKEFANLPEFVTADQTAKDNNK